MGVVRITEAELARDLHDVLAKVKAGAEVVVEQDHRPVAVIKPSNGGGRLLSEVVSALKARGGTAIMDDEFAHAIEPGIQAQRQPWLSRVSSSRSARSRKRRPRLSHASVASGPAKGSLFRWRIS